MNNNKFKEIYNCGITDTFTKNKGVFQCNIAMSFLFNSAGDAIGMKSRKCIFPLKKRRRYILYNLQAF